MLAAPGESPQAGPLVAPSQLFAQALESAVWDDAGRTGPVEPGGIEGAAVWGLMLVTGFAPAVGVEELGALVASSHGAMANDRFPASLGAPVLLARPAQRWLSV